MTADTIKPDEAMLREAVRIAQHSAYSIVDDEAKAAEQAVRRAACDRDIMTEVLAGIARTAIYDRRIAAQAKRAAEVRSAQQAPA